MPPHCKEKSLKVDITQAALPFNAPVYEKTEAKEQIEGGGSQQATSSSSQVEAGYNSVDNSSIRITTRARHTYELDRYKKNAMLIIDNEFNPDLVKTTHNLDETFRKFRFEVEKHFNLNEDEISDVCKRFFQRDFTEYGAVAIALIAKVDSNGALVVPDSVFREHVVTSNFTVNLPATLKGKPIIYISEISDFPTIRSEQMNYVNILNYHIPPSVVSYSRGQSTFRPLSMLSCSINEAGDKESLLDIMTSTISEVIKTCPYYSYHHCPIHITSTLTKDLVLVRS